MNASSAPAAPAQHVTGDVEFCRQMLPRVSRTFALSISFLPERLGYTITVAYLLCRIADTIEDDANRSPEGKRRLLEHFSAALEDGGPGAGPLADAFRESQDAEQGLTASAGRVLAEFGRLSDTERRLIRPWVQEMCRGMAETGDLLAEREAGGLRTLETIDELRRYCYYVAGTVGHLLTDVFQDGLRLPADRTAELHRLAHGFGLGLQLTNIIKDLQDDRARGVSFVPAALCRRHGLAPEMFGDPRHAEATRAVVDELLAEARCWLHDGLDYVTRLPAGAYGIRRFCLSALLLARRTLRRIEQTPGFPHAIARLKITRPEVRRTVLLGSVVAPLNPLVRAYYRAL